LSEALFGRIATGRVPALDALPSAVARIAGFFTAMSLLSPMPGVPRLRQFQADKGRRPGLVGPASGS
jgi:hypothetical protein